MTDQKLDKGTCTGRERLIYATQSLAKGRSFDDITIDEIIKAADLSRPAFYYHFTGGKEELRTELVERGLLNATPAQDTRLATLEAAVRVFARSGVQAATLDDIAAEAGVTRGALCWHFHSKDDLVAAIIKHYSPHSILCSIIDQLAQEMESGVAIDDEAILRRIAEGFYDAFSAQGDFARLAILLTYTHPEAAYTFADMIGRGRRRITGYVRKLQEEGHFRKDIDPGLLIQIMATTFAMRAIGKGPGNLLPFAHLSRGEIVDQLVSILLYGIVNRDSSSKDEKRATL